jgi:hypothetical protein
VVSLKKAEKYFSKHVYINSLTHFAAGLGIGALLTHTLFDPHPVRIGLILIALAVLGHLYAYVKGSK